MKALKQFAIGDRVESGAPGTEDYDTGRVMELLGNGRLWIGWDSQVQTEASCEDLREYDDEHDFDLDDDNEEE
jgi:hypothetical protein